MRALSKLLTLLVLLTALSVHAQQNLILTIADFMTWTPSSPLTVPQNVAAVPLQERVIAPANHIVQGLNPEIKVLYCPDWINNWVPELGVNEPFNKYFISQWQFLDILVWFHGGGVVIPRAPWVNAAHKNGVKVIGTVLFYSNTPGLTSFLTKDAQGKYPAVPILIQMAQYYGFDGWFFNIEQSSTAANATKMAELLAQYKADCNNSLEMIWYDAMTETGSVSYQNALNAKNDTFFANSSGLFTNYWWGTSQITSSVAYAQTMNLSPFKIYTGADMWPGRTAQPAFTDKVWLDQISGTGTNNLRTSLGLFAMNFTFEWTAFSTFINDPNAWLSCYQTERKVFTGVDLNPYLVDNNDYKGLSNYVIPKTVITKMPFSTCFNTGHGLQKWTAGALTSADDWYDMDQQDILPTWAFYRNSATQFVVEYDFTDAYQGGTSLTFQAPDGSLLNNETFKLYKTSIVSTHNFELEITSKYGNTASLIQTSAILYYASGATSEIAITDQGTGSWHTQTTPLTIASGDTLTAIGFSVKAQNGSAASAYKFNLGKIELVSSDAINPENVPTSGSLEQNYPNPFNNQTEIAFTLSNEQLAEAGNISLDVYNISGQTVFTKNLKPQSTTGRVSFDAGSLNSGVYYYSLLINGKKIETKSMVLLK